MAGLFRKVIRIEATDSPNVREGREAYPGILGPEEYERRLRTWDKVKQCIGLRAEFYEGADALLFPPDWLNRAEALARALKGKPRKARAIGCDPAEGGDSSAWSVVDEFGLIELLSLKTPDTTAVPNTTLALMHRYQVPAEYVVLDRGGGGKQAADTLRAKGHRVRTVAFGEPLALEPKHGQHQVSERREMREERTTYKNMRALLYGTLRELLDPATEQEGYPTPFGVAVRGFGIPAEQAELRRQMAPIPLTYDSEGQLFLPPKRRKPGSKETAQKSLEEIIGHSPDELDSCVLAVHGMVTKPSRTKVVFS